MSEPQATLTPPASGPSSFRLVLTLGLIAMLSGFFVVLTVQLTAARIQANKQAALEKAIFSVLPQATQARNLLLTEDGLEYLPNESIDRANAFAGYDAEGKLAGLALEGSARGYQDVVRILYGYSPTDDCIIGMTVLQSTETPGLGDRVETDPAFLANFDCLKAEMNDAGTAMAHEIVTVKHGQKTKPWQIDAISGATVTSTAIGTAIRESTNELLPLLARHKNSLQWQIEPQ